MDNWSFISFILHSGHTQVYEDEGQLLNTISSNVEVLLREKEKPFQRKPQAKQYGWQTTHN